MNEETRAYIEFLNAFNGLKKPLMPKFDVDAYNDNEYRFAIDELMSDYDKVDDLYLTLEHLKGY